MGFSGFALPRDAHDVGWDRHQRAGMWPPEAVFGIDVAQNRGMNGAAARMAASLVRAASLPEAQELRGMMKPSHAGS